MSDATTVYGYWVNHGDRHSLTVAGTVTDAFNSGPKEFDLEAIEAEYRDAINAALPGNLVLVGDMFVGPACSFNKCDGCAVCAEDFEISEIIEGIDLWSIIEKHERPLN